MPIFSLKDEDLKLMEIEPAVASEEVEELPDDIYTQPVSLARGTVHTQNLYAVHMSSSSNKPIFSIKPSVFL